MKLAGRRILITGAALGIALASDGGRTFHRELQETP
jgi:hypothetical protein|tara:strand:- start:97 stop:204 length:108 start_codon:yes stop_codon:yes gene_type:complete